MIASEMCTQGNVHRGKGGCPTPGGRTVIIMCVFTGEEEGGISSRNVEFPEIRSPDLQPFGLSITPRLADSIYPATLDVRIRLDLVGSHTSSRRFVHDVAVTPYRQVTHSGVESTHRRKSM